MVENLSLTLPDNWHGGTCLTSLPDLAKSVLPDDLTWHDGDRLESPEHPERPQAGQVAEVDEECDVAEHDHDEVEPVPRTAQVRVLVQDEALGDRLDERLQRIDG